MFYRTSSPIRSAALPTHIMKWRSISGMRLALQSPTEPYGALRSPTAEYALWKEYSLLEGGICPMKGIFLLRRQYSGVLRCRFVVRQTTVRLTWQKFMHFQDYRKLASLPKRGKFALSYSLGHCNCKLPPDAKSPSLQVYTLFFIRTRILKLKLDVLNILAIWALIVLNHVLN